MKSPIKTIVGFSRVLIVFCIIAISFIPTVGWAESELSFFVQPNFPESQLKESDSYFDLNLAPGAKDTLELVLQNNTENPIAIQVTAHTAFTNVNGVVEYGQEVEEADPTLPYSLEKLIKVPDTIQLAAHEERIVQMPIEMPKDSFEGVLAGGLRVSEVKDSEEPDSEGEGLAIQNEFAFVMGVVVSNQRTSIEPELDLLDVFADQLNYRNVFSATIQNYTSTFVNQLEVEATIRAEGKEEILYKAETTGMQMAPNSHFNYPISLNGDRFQSGTYVLNMVARSGDEEWKWEKKFTIEADAARRLNQEDVTIDSSVNWWLIAACTLFGLLLILIGFVIYKKKELEKKKRNRRKKRKKAKMAKKKEESK